MKRSKTGKPLCSRCRKLATHRLTGHHTVNGRRTPLHVYHCDEHATHMDEEWKDG